MKKIVLVLLCFVLLFSGCGENAKDVVNVKIEIDCSDILNNYDLLDENIRDEKYVPVSGYILELTDVKANVGDGAMEVLKKVAMDNNIPVDSTDTYVKGINSIYEKSCGELSGWVYMVNGESIMEEYTVSEGDIITWKYICDFTAFEF